MIFFYNYKFSKHFFCFLMASFLFCSMMAQDAAKLNIGEQAPNLVLSSNNNSIQSFSFPYQNKVVLLFFWSSTVSKSQENIYKYKRLYSKYSDVDYKTCDGFDVISVALQSDKIAWEQALKDYDLSKINNCVAQKGYNDIFIKNYKISQTPSSFLIDELGKIVSVNPSIKTIIDYLDNKRSATLNTDVQTKLAGKIMFGKGTPMPLSNEKLWLLSDKKDSIESVVLDDRGAFLFKNINAAASYNLYLKNNSKITDDHFVFLTSENGNIVSNFKINEIGYDYTILDAEMPYLKPLYDNEVVVKKDSGAIKNLYYSGMFFNSKENVLSSEAISKLNSIIAKLKSNAKVKVDIVSHTDSNGDAAANTVISLKQSNSIAAYLITKGISKTRLKSIGKGEFEILNKCRDAVQCSEAEHSVNRRTEFKFYPIQ